jgi:protein phosphatase
MGGAQAGEVASRIAIEAFEHDLPGGMEAQQGLVARVREANRRIYDCSREERERAGMGTTLTAAYLEDQTVAIAHVGDSRAYMLRDGSLQRLTRDHSLVDELVRQGKLTEEQAAEHPQRSIITRALGIDAEVEVDTWTYSARAGDVVLLCSDGLSSFVAGPTIEQIVTRFRSDLRGAAHGLIHAANRAGGDDNITAVLFELVERAGSEPDERTREYPQAPDDAETLHGGTDVRFPAVVDTIVMPAVREPIAEAGPGKRALALLVIVILIALILLLIWRGLAT